MSTTTSSGAFRHPSVVQAIADAASRPDDLIRANADNFRWDERLSPQRVALFEQLPYVPSGNSWDDLVDSYVRYFVDRMEWDGRGAITDPFRPENGGAALEQLPDDKRELVRLVRIEPTLRAVGLETAAFQGAVDLYTKSGGNVADAAVRDARAVIEVFLNAWNAFEHRAPSFVGFALDVAPDLKESDALVRLRDRFGMGKWHVAPGAEPIPVMLLRYPVRAVVNAALPYCDPVATFRVPTVFDANLYEYFFPAPTPLPIGRTVHLGGRLDESALTCELIHLPVNITLEQIVTVGKIDCPIPDVALGRLRDVHLWLLRYEIGRDDFGEWMCGHEPD